MQLLAAQVRDTPRSMPVLADDAIRELVDNLRSVAIVRLDLTGRILSWNHGAERILGHAPAHVVGRFVSTLLAPDDVAKGLADRLRAACAPRARSMMRVMSGAVNQ